MNAASPFPRRHEPVSETPVHAALDLGTNNCRLLLAAPGGPDGFRVLDSFSRMVRLGEGIGATGAMSPAAMDRALGALAICRAKLARRPIRAARAVATEACRRATNGAAFLARAETALGLPIELISTREEAALAMESCAPLLEPGDRRALLFDIGGGSTEVAWIRAPRHWGESPSLIGYVSIPLGVVTVAERPGPTCAAPEGFAAVMEEVGRRLEAFDSVHCIRQEIRAGGVRMMGTSGTVTTLAGIALALPRYSRPLVDGQVLASDQADDALDRLRAMGPCGMARHPCIGPERAEFVLPGCAIYAGIRHIWPTEELTVCDRGLREGMLLRLMRGQRGPSRRLAWRTAPGPGQRPAAPVS
ncbi:Ppx/GppA family phosphatase [Roseomonas sp. OT10]|uniref:Ppx/GppA phosphatase family protein n=1 Tax=Roseomonas cutis TaxID=2897332 RepID=UPI001E42E96D|nr:Ppx/GppA family phosphatase [Roseomonas sp. OT10]UFN50921.1 Ppx/GppA family phosphatase [Roseomonas sp. OT10]